MSPLRAVGIFGIATALAACAPRLQPLPLPAPETLTADSPLRSRTLAEPDAWLRHYLMTGDPDAALRLIESRRFSSDRLLRKLQTAVVLHQAGRFRASNAAFAWAEQEADRRWTRSLRRAAGSLLLSDRTLAYLPSEAEMLAIPRYRMLNHLALGERDEAAVEARRASRLADRIEEQTGGCAGTGLTHYLAGLVFDAAGERSDALVSLRRASRVFGACTADAARAVPATLGADLARIARALGLHELADSVAAPAAPPTVSLAGPPIFPVRPPAAGDSAELVVVIENGFAAHRAAEDLYVPVPKLDVDDLESDDSDRIALVAERIAVRLAGVPAMRSGGPVLLDDADDEVGATYLLKLAWPAMRLEANRSAGLRVVVDDAAVPAPPAENVSAAVISGWEAQRSGVAARMLTRSVTRYLLAREAERKADKQGGKIARWLVGALVNGASNAVERADTRSWSLLPDRVSLVRVRVPAGEHDIRIERLSPGGEVVGVEELGTVVVRPGERIFLQRRVWGSEGGETPGRKR